MSEREPVPELVRVRMAPPFAVTTTDGQKISLDDLQGKVVLLVSWATWCGPCREALPHLTNIAKKFEGEPLVILSVSLDSDQLKWKDFITRNEINWPQYCDGGLEGSISKLFGVRAIPHTFTIEADGALQNEHIGDASIEGKLKKLLARARDLQSAAIPAKLIEKAVPLACCAGGASRNCRDGLGGLPFAGSCQSKEILYQVWVCRFCRE